MLRACSRFERWDDKRARHFWIVCLVVFYWSISSNKCAHFTLQGAPCLRQVELSWTLKFGRVPVQWMKAAKPRALFVGESQKSNGDLRTPAKNQRTNKWNHKKKQDFGSPYPITFFVLLFLYLLSLFLLFISFGCSRASVLPTAKSWCWGWCWVLKCRSDDVAVCFC